MKTKLTTKDRVEIAIRCALDIGDSDHFESWAKRYLGGEIQGINDSYIAAMFSLGYPAYNAAFAAYYAERAADASGKEKLSDKTLCFLAVSRAAESIKGAHRRGANTAGIIGAVLREGDNNGN